MNKTVAGIVITVLAIVVAGGAVLIINKDDKDEATVDHSQYQEQAAQSTSNPTANTSETQNDTEAVQTTSVEIKDYAYSPGTIRVKKGTAVTWTNQDGVQHNVNPDQSSANFKGSDLLSKGESYTFTFNAIGTYTYHCSPHPYMKGTVEVVD